MSGRIEIQRIRPDEIIEIFNGGNGAPGHLKDFHEGNRKNLAYLDLLKYLLEIKADVSRLVFLETPTVYMYDQRLKRNVLCPERVPLVDQGT